MITEIRELTTIKKTNEITSEQILGWTKRVQAQRAQKAILEEATKESLETYQQINSPNNTKRNTNCKITAERVYL